MVQPSPVFAGAAGHPGEPVHAGEQPVVPSRRLHAAGLRDHAAGAVHALRQRSLVGTSLCSSHAFFTRSFINNGGQRGRPFLSGRRRHTVSRSEKSPPQPVSPSGCSHVSTFRLLWSSCVVGTFRKCPKHVYMKLHPHVCCEPG